jgi:hypothetical protein
LKPATDREAHRGSRKPDPNRPLTERVYLPEIPDLHGPISVAWRTSTGPDWYRMHAAANRLNPVFTQTAVEILNRVLVNWTLVDRHGRPVRISLDNLQRTNPWLIVDLIITWLYGTETTRADWPAL